jgi:phosphate transport system substrate-binding protein
MGAIAIGYNLPIDTLKLDGDTLSAMYLGTIKTWNDPRVTALNPNVRLPDTPVVVTYRADSSGSTFLLTSYLSSVNATWKTSVGAAGAVAWPAGVGAKGSAGVSGVVKSTPGAIGYFELSYAKKNQIRTALVKNSAGHFIEPSPASAAAASEGAVANMSPDLKAIFVNAPGERSYPIAGFSWIIAFKNQKDVAKARAIVDLLRFTVTTGQRYAENLDYAPLPLRVQELDERAIQSIVIPSGR